ncbi:DUF2529 family protein [Bacillus solitudinis]|uniref:DUF2529 family protein n=1 Tax=Bacillus solitudinis TaxID=2014074 RepID=UPI000C238514|nr:DUF2529 family protein [Bacillus solitudinis]
MIQIFTTQLTGLMKAIQEKQIDSLEDAGRLLAQTIIAKGTVYVYGTKEMAAVSAEALYGKEALGTFLPLANQGNMHTPGVQDRVLLVSRSSDEDILVLARDLYKNSIPFVAISTVEEADDELVTLADVHINLDVTRSLVPQDDGSKIGYPASLIALYTFFCLHLTIHDIISEYE